MPRHKFDPNPTVDFRHNLAEGTSVPSDKNTTLDIVFCKNCRKMATEFEIVRYGCCMRCKGIEFTGGWETFWEAIKLRWWMFTNDWRVTGKWRKENTN